MKKKLLTLLAICLLPLALLAGSGDVNGDGKVNVADLVELINYCQGHASEHFNFEAADVNNDGTVDDNDIEFFAGQLVSGVDADFELVIEMIDGTTYTVPITEDYPTLRYESRYVSDDMQQNVINITTSSAQSIVRSQEVMRLLTRKYSGNTILPSSQVSEDQTDPYSGQHVSIKRTTGDSIQYDISNSFSFKPVVKEGKVVWSFQSLEEKEGSQDHETELKDKFSVDNVESFDFRSFEYDEREARKALIEFYQEMDGDNWPHKDNWCSDKPIWEWYGVNSNCMDIIYTVPWVKILDLSDFFFGQWDYSPGAIPECIVRMGLIESLLMPNFMLKGSIPEFLGNILSLIEIDFYGNQLSGEIPESISKLPHLNLFDIQSNQFKGLLPEKFTTGLMDRLPGNNANFNNNYFTGKIPESIRNHPNFAGWWPTLLTQRGEGLDLSDLEIPAPVFSTTDIEGNSLNLAEVYKKNQYTLLYKWALWCPFSEEFNKKLVPVYNAYKDKEFEIIGIHYDINGDDGLSDYMKGHDIPWTNIIANDWASNFVDAAIFQWGGTPEVYLVDQNGHIVFNSYLDENGQLPLTYVRRERLFPYLEERLGKVDYNFYTSTDLTHDGEVTTLQTAATGLGIDLVFVGEGFTDKDIENNDEFDYQIQKAMNQFFAYEPYTSLRDRFNVYSVKAVSPNAEFYGDAKHAIDEDAAKAFEYASKVPGLRENAPLFVNVIYKEDTGGRSYCKMLEDGSYVAFMMDGVTSVLSHEAGGHGIGKLFDEYVEYTGLTLPEENKNELESQWTTLGWGANVDWRSNPTEVKWTKFINDSRYVDEKIGIYEGGYLYQFGAYRPTENSMMRYNDMPFNAPSREAIYKRVMQLSEGDTWTYDYETFVAFDAAGHQQFVDVLNSASRARTRGSNVRDGSTLKSQSRITTRPPVFLKGTWRDVIRRK